MKYTLNVDTLENIKMLIGTEDIPALKKMFQDIHTMDIAEIMNQLTAEQANFLFQIGDRSKMAKILLELNDDVREYILDHLSSKEIAREIGILDTDDAADIISELSKEKKNEVIGAITDTEHASDIVELLKYSQDSAGGLMAKEFVSVNENWSVSKSMNEMRKQAKNISRVHSIYVVDNENKLKGRLSLKDLLTIPTNENIKDVYIKNVDFVKVDDTSVEVARIMQKYDLEAIPVIDAMGRLIGRITIDDIMDVIKEEADKDYAMAAGLSADVEANDSIIDITKARLPWLLLALFGSFIAVNVAQNFEGAMTHYGVLFFFTPLIAAMAGNVGVQSSAIIVQGLANNTISGSIPKRLLKEVLLSLLNGAILSIVLLFATHFILNIDYSIGITVAISLITVIIIASLIGTFMPLILHKYHIDPALATGPFITTSNDIFGILIYFSIAKVLLGF